MDSISSDKTMIAPCGINCGVCMVHLREKNKCPGCHGQDEKKPKHCVTCRLKHCEELNRISGTYCFQCKGFPCTRLKQFDKRYMTKYGMSVIDNLNMIKEKGIDEFLLTENQKWACNKCGGVVCVHTWKCSECGDELENPSAKL